MRLPETGVEYAVPGISWLPELSSSNVSVPVGLKPPAILARSWTVTAPAATAAVGCRMVVVRVGQAVPTVNVS